MCSFSLLGGDTQINEWMSKQSVLKLECLLLLCMLKKNVCKLLVCASESYCNTALH